MKNELNEINKEITQTLRCLDLTLDQLDKMEEDTIRIINESRKSFRARATKLQALSAQLKISMFQYELTIKDKSEIGDNSEE